MRVKLTTCPPGTRTTGAPEDAVEPEWATDHNTSPTRKARPGEGSPEEGAAGGLGDQRIRNLTSSAQCARAIIVAMVTVDFALQQMLLFGSRASLICTVS